MVLVLEGHLGGKFSSHSLLKDTPCFRLLLPWPKPWASPDGASTAPKPTVALLGLCVTPPSPARAVPKLVQDRRGQKSRSLVWLAGERSLHPTVSVPSPVLPGSPNHHPEGTMLPSQRGPSILSATGLYQQDQRGRGGRGGALGAICNAVIPLRPWQNCRLHESPQQHLARPMRSPKGSLDHTRAAADNEQARSPPGEAGREQAESRQGWGARGPSWGSPEAQQVVAWPRYGVTVPTVPLAKGTGYTFGVQSPALSPARDVLGEPSLSQHPASRQELHGCNDAAVSARSLAAGSPRHQAPLRDTAQVELGWCCSVPQCQGDGLALHTPWLWGPCLQAAHQCQCRAGRRQGTARSLCPPPACPACLQPHTHPLPLPCNTMPKEGRGVRYQTSCVRVSRISEPAGPGMATRSPSGCGRAGGCCATCPGQMAGGPRGVARHGTARGPVPDPAVRPAHIRPCGDAEDRLWGWQ